MNRAPTAPAAWCELDLRALALLQLFDQLRHDFEEVADYRTWKSSRLFGDDFTVLPNKDGGSVHACGFARGFARAAERATDGRRKLFCFSFHLRRFHGPSSSSRGLAPELSYTFQISAKGR